MKLIFVRHGESTANRLHVFANLNYAHPLTEDGLRQAREVARALAGTAVERVYTSPLLRAAQTARILAEGLGAPLEVSEALREWSVGVFEGTGDPAGWEQHRKVQEDWFERGDFASRMPGGESHDDIRARFFPFIEDLVWRHSSPAGCLLLVAHGGLYLAMLPYLFDNLQPAFARAHGFPYTGCVTAEARGARISCLSWCGLEPGG